MSVFVTGVEWRGEQNMKTHATSEWACRSFCGECGSGLMWRMTHPNMDAIMSVSLGTLDDRTGLEFNREWFVDQKPALYAFAGDRARVTEAEALAMLDEALAPKEP